MNTLEMISCKCCGQPMPKLRLELYGYDFCIKCSTVKPKVGRTLVLGQGDHTWNDLEILDQDVAKKVIELETTFKSNKGVGDLDLLDYNEEESFDDSIETVKNGLQRATSEYDPDKPVYVEEEDEEEEIDDENELEKDLDE